MKLAMTIDEALEFADEWSRGMTLHEGSQGWRVVCMLLAEEVRLKRDELAHVGSADEVTEKNAERYRWLRDRLIGADFDWNDSGTFAAVFEWPQNSPISANCDMSIDDAMAQTHNAEGKPTPD